MKKRGRPKLRSTIYRELVEKHGKDPLLTLAENHRNGRRKEIIELNRQRRIEMEITNSQFNSI